MSVTIKNLTASHIWLTLNSRASLRLSPGQTSREIPDVEVTNNAKVEKMQRQRLIGVEDVKDQMVLAGHADAKSAEASTASESSVESGAQQAGGLGEESEGATPPRAGKKSGPRS